MPKILISTFVLIALVPIHVATVAAEKNVPFQRYPLDERQIGIALAAGARAKGRMTGLSLKDSGQSFLNAMSSMDGSGGQVSTGFSLEIYTPYAWIAQQASWEAKKYKTMKREQVTEEMLSGVLRVYANPDVARTLTSDGMRGASGVEHVIIRTTDKEDFKVLQPTELFEAEEYAQNAFGAEVAFASKEVYFNLDEVSRISSLNKKGEFFVVVIGVTGEEKKFKVKTKHFSRLP